MRNDPPTDVRRDHGLVMWRYGGKFCHITCASVAIARSLEERLWDETEWTMKFAADFEVWYA